MEAYIVSGCLTSMSQSIRPEPLSLHFSRTPRQRLSIDKRKTIELWDETYEEGQAYGHSDCGGQVDQVL